MEARLYAEDPSTGFLPSTGTIAHFGLNEGAEDPNPARVDAAVSWHSEVTPYYDPMIAKLIVHSDTRAHAITRLQRQCEDVAVWPVKTNAGFLARCLADEGFKKGDVDTGLISSRGAVLTDRPPPSDDAALAAANELEAAAKYPAKFRDTPASTRESPWVKLKDFRLNAQGERRARLRYEGKSIIVTMRGDSAHAYAATHGDKIVAFERGEAYLFTADTGEVEGGEAAASDGAILSPMPGKIVSVAAKAGAKLKKGDPILVLEAMKMEHTLTAPFDGKLAELNAKAGAQVSEGVVLAKIEKD
jgi:acetyl/propionyl-CoA carboxylase alpha subunit